MKKLLSLILTLLMLVSIFGTAVLAESRPVFKVVNLGDSSSVGFGLGDFGVYSRRPYIASSEQGYEYGYSILNLGFLDTGSRSAYPARLAAYISAKLPEYDVEFTNLGISGIRANDICAVLDPEYQGDTESRLYWSEDFGACVSSLYDLTRWNNDFHKLFTTELASADLITLDCCMNSFTGCLMSRISAAFTGDDSLLGDYDGTIDALYDKVSPEIKALIDGYGEFFSEICGGVFPHNIVTGALDAIVYSFLDFCVSFTEVVRLVRELNPDAIILVGGSYNPFHGMAGSYKGIFLDISELCSAFLGIVDTYMTTFCPYRDTYSFIDLPDNIETFREYMGSAGTMWDVSDEFAYKLVDDLCATWTEPQARELYNMVAELAAERGVEITPYSSFWVSVVHNAINDVRKNGESASDESRIFTEVYGKYIELILKSMSIDCLDLEAAIAAANEDAYALLLSYMDTEYEGLTQYERSALYIAVAKDVRSGIAAHFSYEGCAQKYCAALKALDEQLPASAYSAETVFDAGAHTMSGLFNTLSAPLVKTLDRLLSLFDPADFFRNVSSGVSSFLLKLISC